MCAFCRRHTITDAQNQTIALMRAVQDRVLPSTCGDGPKSTVKSEANGTTLYLNWQIGNRNQFGEAVLYCGASQKQRAVYLDRATKGSLDPSGLLEIEPPNDGTNRVLRWGIR